VEPVYHEPGMLKFIGYLLFTRTWLLLMLCRFWILACNKSNGKGHSGCCNSWKRRISAQQIQHMVL
jgi:hypothetical protein